ncbi:LolA family protein [Cupriavidus sp. H18C2]|uniref:LolA family protein n=1 Tax=Cupriavidus sp. H18C2 TaxID=3241602 RepID=UPI003BF827EF
MNRRQLLRGVLLGAAMLLGLPAHAADLLGDVAARLADAPVIRGQFEQTRKLPGFSHPLVSRGDFVLAKSRGVVWATREPFASSLLVTPDRLVMRGGGRQGAAADAGRFAAGDARGWRIDDRRAAWRSA